MEDAKKLWENAIIEIGLSVSRANFSTWFQHTSISRLENDVVYLSVPNAFVKDWLSNKYHKLILKSLRNAAQGVRGLEYIIQKADEPQARDHEKMEKREAWSDQLKFHELSASREDNLNPKYTFDTFVVGTFNEVAHAASQAVLKNLGTSYNPLFIYGGTGLGKTHLIQSIGNALKKLYPDKRPYYMTIERYSAEFVGAVQENKRNAFKDKYRKYDMLIVDDVQFISGLERTQEEMFHLFNHLYEKNKQIVFSSDKPPKNIDRLEGRLQSRFEGGMIVDISKPDYESRLAILKSKICGMQFAPQEEVIEYVASSVQDNIRELEGVLNAIVCQCQMRNRPLSIGEIKNLVKNHAKPQKTISIKDVIRVVSDFYNVEERMLYEKTRRKEVVKPRQVIMYILREDFNTSYPYIGQKLGGRDHTTVIHAYEKIKNDMKENNVLVQELDQIKTLLQSNLQAA